MVKEPNDATMSGYELCFHRSVSRLYEEWRAGREAARSLGSREDGTPSAPPQRAERKAVA